MQRYSSITLYVSPKNQISAEKLKITLSKIQILPQNFFTEWFCLKQIEAIHFQYGFHDKSAQTDCSKEMWIPILKGLKYMNTVVYSSSSSLSWRRVGLLGGVGGLWSTVRLPEGGLQGKVASTSWVFSHPSQRNQRTALRSRAVRWWGWPTFVEANGPEGIMANYG